MFLHLDFQIYGYFRKGIGVNPLYESSEQHFVCPISFWKNRKKSYLSWKWRGGGQKKLVEYGTEKF